MNPNDRYFSEQWALTRLGAPQAWDCIDPNAPEVIVAVVDTGVADNHEDLQTRLLSPDTVINILRDDDDHGTMVAGTIGAIANNSRGIAGAAKVQLLSVKFCSGQTWPEPALGAEAIRRAADFTLGAMRTRVIVLAWDVGYDTEALRAAIDYAGTKDAVVVVAAGNHSLDNDLYPNWPANHGKDMDHVITVMATDKNDERASFSNFGKTSVHIAAPGVDILTTSPYYGPLPAQGSIPTGYRSFRGTSASAAYVAALAALIRANHPTWTAAEVKSHVRSSARWVPSLERFCETGGIADYVLAICGPDS